MTDHKDIVNNFMHKAAKIYLYHSENMPDGIITHSEKFKLGQLFTRELQTEATAAIEKATTNPEIDDTQLQKDIYDICHIVFKNWEKEFPSE